MITGKFPNLRLRRNKISNDIERAELIKTQVENITVEYEEKIEKAKARANETIKNAYEKASLEFSSQLSGAKKKISQKINEAETEIIEYKNHGRNHVPYFKNNQISSYNRFCQENEKKYIDNFINTLYN